MGSLSVELSGMKCGMTMAMWGIFFGVKKRGSVWDDCVYM